MSSIVYDFNNKPFAKTIDDMAKLRVAPDNQKFLEKDYAKYAIHSFAKFGKWCAVPQWFTAKYGKDYVAMNRYIATAIEKGDGIHWTNRTLSYSNRDIQFNRVYRAFVIEFIKKIGGSATMPITVVDATGNIGGDSIQFALKAEVSNVIVYEMQSESCAMLRNNVKLFHLEDRVKVINGRFDYKIPKGCLVMLDPPFEAYGDSDSKNAPFTLSIEPEPIYYVVENILNAGAAAVMLNMPEDFTYNLKFAKKAKQDVYVIRITNKHIKKYMIVRDCPEMVLGGRRKIHVAAGTSVEIRPRYSAFTIAKSPDEGLEYDADVVEIK